MSSCPVCQGAIEGSFGMVVCPSCGTAVFFDISGEPQVAGSEPSPDNHVEPTVYANQNNERTIVESQETLVVSRPQFADLQLEEPQTLFSKSMGDNDETVFTSSGAVKDFSETPLESIEESEPEETGELFDPNAFLENQNRAPLPADQVLSEINEFANSEIETFGLSYNVRISGIDTSDIRKAVLEELRDSRLGWSILEVEAKINKGELYLQKLNPVKASLIVNRLKSIEVDVDWSQNA